MSISSEWENILGNSFLLTAYRAARAATEHPLARPLAGTLERVVRWQVASRASREGLVVPFVDRTRLLVTKGMTGATGNVYFGLHEFESMGFILHFLCESDLFLDVGANVGTYTVLASGVRNSKTIAFEPIPETFEHLCDNVRLNGLSDRVVACKAAVGEKQGVARITADLDTMNHIAVDERIQATIEVEVVTLDGYLEETSPAAMKIDVEGFELSVLLGAKRRLESSSLLAVIAETNDLGSRYGKSNDDTVALLARHGFEPYSYDPKSRVLQALDGPRVSGNTLFLRNLEMVRRRIATSKPFRVIGVTL